MFFLYMTNIDLFSLSIFIFFVLFSIPGTCAFYNSWKKNFFLSIRDQNNQLSCRILRKDELWLALKGSLSCMVNAKSFLADWIQNRFMTVYNRGTGRNWYIALNGIFPFLWYSLLQFFSFRNDCIAWRK